MKIGSLEIEAREKALTYAGNNFPTYSYSELLELHVEDAFDLEKTEEGADYWLEQIGEQDAIKEIKHYETAKNSINRGYNPWAE